MFQRGATQADAATRFGVHRHTVSSLWTRYQDTGLAHDQPRSGGPHVTSQRQVIYTRVVYLHNRYQTTEATDLIMPGLRRISGKTVRNCLCAYGIQPHRSCAQPVLLSRHHRAWLQWLQNHQRWRLVQWEAVLFTDDSRFHLDGSDGQQRVCRRTGECYWDGCVSQQHQYCGGQCHGMGALQHMDEVCFLSRKAI